MPYSMEAETARPEPGGQELLPKDAVLILIQCLRYAQKKAALKALFSCRSLTVLAPLSVRLPRQWQEREACLFSRVGPTGRICL